MLALHVTRVILTVSVWLCSKVLKLLNCAKSAHQCKRLDNISGYKELTQLRLISVTPAGRRRYLKILTNYLLRNRHVIDEHHWWVNTRNPGDLAYLHQLVDRYPGFFKLVVKPIDASAQIGAQIWSYLSDCVEEDAVYIRLDDDICYIADDAIQNMLDYRLANENPFLVLGSIVNNAVCSYYYQKAGLIPESWGKLSEDCQDPLGWESSTFANKIHTRFLHDIARGYEGKWKRCPNQFSGIQRFSVNAISWLGKDLKQVEELHRKGIDEENLITNILPQRFDRPNEICTDALFGHYAFFTQRRYLEMVAPQILDQYLRISEKGGNGSIPQPTLTNHASLAMLRGIGRAKWVARGGIHMAKGISKSILKGRPKEAMKSIALSGKNKSAEELRVKSAEEKNQEISKAA